MQNKNLTEEQKRKAVELYNKYLEESAREMVTHRLPVLKDDTIPDLTTMIVDYQREEGYRFRLTAKGEERLKITSSEEELIIPAENHIVHEKIQDEI